MRTPEHLHEQALRMLAVALTTDDKTLIDRLTIRAGEYLDEAFRLERLNAEAMESARETGTQIGPMDVLR